MTKPKESAVPQLQMWGMGDIWRIPLQNSFNKTKVMNFKLRLFQGQLKLDLTFIYNLIS